MSDDIWSYEKCPSCGKEFIVYWNTSSSDENFVDCNNCGAELKVKTEFSISFIVTDLAEPTNSNKEGE